MPSQKVPESGVLRACLDLLAAERIWHERRNTGGMKGEYNGKKRFVKFSEKGTPDIMATPRTIRLTDWDEFGEPRRRLIVDGPPCVLWIECKSDSGQQTEDQLAFEKEVSNHGHHYLVVRDVDTLKKWLVEHRVIRGE